MVSWNQDGVRTSRSLEEDLILKLQAGKVLFKLHEKNLKQKFCLSNLAFACVVNSQFFFFQFRWLFSFHEKLCRRFQGLFFFCMFVLWVTAGPTWLKNLYFTYTVALRAIIKAAPFWEQEQFYTGDYGDDVEVQELVQVLLAKSK